jgi:hypothetical protein
VRGRESEDSVYISEIFHGFSPFTLSI